MNKYVKIGIMGFSLGAALTVAYYLNKKSPYEDLKLNPPVYKYHGEKVEEKKEDTTYKILEKAR